MKKVPSILLGLLLTAALVTGVVAQEKKVDFYGMAMYRLRYEMVTNTPDSGDAAT